MRLFTLLALVLGLSACSSQSEVTTSPLAPGIISGRSLSIPFEQDLPGLWTGTTTSTSGGSNGTLSLLVTLKDSGAFSANVTWVSNKTALTYIGDADGNVKSQINVHAHNAPLQCEWKATATLNEAQTQMTGDYFVQGNNCATTERADGQVHGQSGTFSITKQGQE